MTEFFRSPLTFSVLFTYELIYAGGRPGQSLFCSRAELQVEALTHRVLIDRPPLTNVSTFLILTELNGRYALGLICSYLLNCLSLKQSLQLQNGGSGRKSSTLSFNTSLGIFPTALLPNDVQRIVADVRIHIGVERKKK